MKDYKNILVLNEAETDRIEAIIFCNEERDTIEDEINRIKRKYYDRGIDRDYMFTELEYIVLELRDKYEIDCYILDYCDDIYY